MTDLETFLSSHQLNNTRAVILCKGNDAWFKDTILPFIQQCRFNNTIQIPTSLSDELPFLSYKQTHQLLGVETDCLVINIDPSFHANAFNAAIGSLVGGGLLILYQHSNILDDMLNPLLLKQLEILPQWNQNKGFFSGSFSLSESTNSSNHETQLDVISSLSTYLCSDKKRTVTLTAERGRGKSAALGIASAHFLKKGSGIIYVISSRFDSVKTLFRHTANELGIVHDDKHQITQGNNQITFFPPDQLLSSDINNAIIIVDEASSIPLPILKRMSLRARICIFSTTTTGYEGSGRGFLNKFLPWLHDNFKKVKSLYLEQPIRWANSDFLESWTNRTFLLDTSIHNPNVPNSNASLIVRNIERCELLTSPQLLQNIWSILQLAHYQTTPNDLFSFFNDPKQSMYVAFLENVPVGCVLTVEEGSLSQSLSQDIIRGLRRPKGHLVTASLLNHYGVVEFGQLINLRVMRIAVLSNYQSQGVGRAMLHHISNESHFDVLSTSFGATSELISFWCQQGFKAVKIGFKQDKASGMNSVIMLKYSESCVTHSDGWVDVFKSQFYFHLSSNL
ncbi:GNAT family N-acetyltransferase, partial [Vibrio sp.]|nr:GNAT family N-acetyltransferase [Vibrio sp.]